MSKVFLINIGANTSHGGKARGPIFADDRYHYVSFPHPGTSGYRSYPLAVRPFTRNVNFKHTHLDPDWENLTYGDCCRGIRGSALRHAKENDILLFWGLLWRNTGMNWDGFTGEKGWYLFGALRIDEILEADEKPTDAKPCNVMRASQNAHFSKGALASQNRVFIGKKAYSARFSKAINLEAPLRSGLLFETVRTTEGKRLTAAPGPRCWIGQTRPCRVIWDLDDAEQRSRAKVVRKAILKQTGFDLLRDVSVGSGRSAR